MRCTKCPVRYFSYSGSTRMMWYHLVKEHRISKPGTKGQSQTQSATTATVDSDEGSRSSSPEILATEKNPTPSPSSKPPPMTQISVAEAFARANAKREPKDKIYARMAAKDRISFHTLANSYDIQQRIVKEGHKPYLCHKTVAR